MEIAEKLEEQIKACIHCGMCLPACPTYNVTANEANSPRGRIYLINELVQGKDELEQDLSIEYLDNCLSCFACETVCPSNVDYEGILHYAREDMKLSKYNKGFFAFLRKIFFKFFINNRFLLRLLRSSLKVFSFLIKPLMQLLGFAAQTKFIPDLKADYKSIQEGEIYYSEHKLDLDDKKRTINFSLGCVMDTVYNDVHADTIYVLNAFGFHVHISRSKCCGSLAAHSGENKEAQKLKGKFLKTIEKEALPLISNSAGCGAFLKDAKPSFGVYDLIEALQRAPYDPLNSKTLKAQVLYHPACHLNHRQGVSDSYEQLLAAIEGLEVYTLDQKDLCCGSAGFYNLIKTDMAAQIGDLKAKEIKETRLKTLITANPGCMSQIKAHLDDDYQVVHPASFLRKILES